MSSMNDIERLTDEVCEELPYNPPVSEVRQKLSEYLQLGLDTEQAKEITLDVFAVRREVLDELEFDDDDYAIAYDLPTYNRADWR